jgi:hypothetical protein
MLAGVKMFSGVFVLGRIAAAHVPARHTHAQVNPRVAEFYAFFANMRIRGCDFYLIQVLAFLCHLSSLVTSISELGHPTLVGLARIDTRYPGASAPFSMRENDESLKATKAFNS